MVDNFYGPEDLNEYYELVGDNAQSWKGKYDITFDWPKTDPTKDIKIRLRPETNAERIRSMTDEELAVFLGNTKAFCCRDSDPSEEFTAEFKAWLKQPAVDNGACSVDETSEKVKEEE